jgi:hypothetical protein
MLRTPLTRLSKVLAVGGSDSGGLRTDSSQRSPLLAGRSTR